MKKKILYLCDYSLEKIGGAQKSTITVCQQMSDIYDVYVTSEYLKDKRDIENGKYTVLEFFSPKNKYFRFLYKLFFLLKIVYIYKPDIIHVQFAQFSYVLMFAVKYKMIDKSIRLIYTDRHFFDGYNKKYQKNYIDSINNWSDITFTTLQNKSKWETALKNKKYDTKFSVIPNVLDNTWFENIEYKKSVAPFVVGFSGRFVDWKRWDIVQQICESLKNEDIYFKIAISSGANNSIEQEKMDEYIKHLKKIMTYKIEVFENLCEEDMKVFYSTLDIFILTSENESFGRTLIEAMTRHVVTISSDSGGAPEVVGRNDLLFQLDDIKRIISLVEFYLNNKIQLQNDKEWFYNRVINKYKVDVMREALINVYEGER